MKENLPAVFAKHPEGATKGLKSLACGLNADAAVGDEGGVVGDRGTGEVLHKNLRGRFFLQGREHSGLVEDAAGLAELAEVVGQQVCHMDGVFADFGAKKLFFERAQLIGEGHRLIVGIWTPR